MGDLVRLEARREILRNLLTKDYTKDCPVQPQGTTTNTTTHRLDPPKNEGVSKVQQQDRGRTRKSGQLSIILTRLTAKMKGAISGCKRGKGE